MAIPKSTNTEDPASDNIAVLLRAASLGQATTDISKQLNGETHHLNQSRFTTTGYDKVAQGKDAEEEG